MIEIGVKQKLTVINMVDFGVYLGQPGHEEKVREYIRLRRRYFSP